jgi:hypothetical protein
MTTDEKLAQSLKVKFGTAPSEPTGVQLQQIKAAIQRIQSSGKTPSEHDWLSAVSMYCPSTGQYRYAGIDNSDLNTLLALAIQVANKQGK